MYVLQKISPHLSQLNVAMAHVRIILGEIICESSNWQHIQRLKITILGANWQLLDFKDKGLPNVHILFCLEHKTSKFTDL